MDLIKQSRWYQIYEASIGGNLHSQHRHDGWITEPIQSLCGLFQARITSVKYHLDASFQPMVNCMCESATLPAMRWRHASKCFWKPFPNKNCFGNRRTVFFGCRFPKLNLLWKSESSISRTLSSGAQKTLHAGFETVIKSENGVHMMHRRRLSH